MYNYPACYVTFVCHSRKFYKVKVMQIIVVLGLVTKFLLQFLGKDERKQRIYNQKIRSGDLLQVTSRCGTS